jgi:hypothetical protein
MANILDLRKRVLLVSKNAPEFIVEEALFDTVQDLCVNAEVWQAMVDVAAVVGSNEMTVTPPADTIVVRTMWANLGGRKLSALSNAEWLDITATPHHGCPDSYLQDSNTKLLLYPTPKIVEVGQVRAVFALANGASTLPDDLLALYKETIVDGALARVMATPTDFGDVRLADYYNSRWQLGLDRAKGRANRPKDNRAIVATYGGY